MDSNCKTRRWLISLSIAAGLSLGCGAQQPKTEPRAAAVEKPKETAATPSPTEETAADIAPPPKIETKVAVAGDPPPPQPVTPPKEVTEADVTVPDGTVKELVDILEVRQKVDYGGDYANAFKTHVFRILKASEKLLAKPDADAATKEKARSGKLQALSAASGFDPKYSARFDEYAAQLVKEFPGSEIAALASGRKLMEKVQRQRSGEGFELFGSKTTPPSDEEFAKTMNELAAFAKEYPKTQFAAALYLSYAMALDRSDLKKSVAVMEKAIALLPPDSPAAERLKAMLVNKTIVGKNMELAGPTLAGGDFNIESLKGKVVLVDFWATWCGPCVAELPHVKAAYEKYHDKGFEVVAVSLDSDVDELKSFVKQNSLPWPQIIFGKDEDRGWNNPLSRKYGIMGIPATFLVDQTGKVVDRDLRGPAIDAAIEKALDIKATPLSN